jgi:hypothetical protein
MCDLSVPLKTKTATARRRRTEKGGGACWNMIALNPSVLYPTDTNDTRKSIETFIQRQTTIEPLVVARTR